MLRNSSLTNSGRPEKKALPLSLAEDPAMAYGRGVAAYRAIAAASAALNDVLKYTKDSKAKQHAGTADRTLQSAAAIVVKLNEALKSGKAPEA